MQSNVEERGFLVRAILSTCCVIAVAHLSEDFVLILLQFCQYYFSVVPPRVGSWVERIDPLHSLAGCHKR